MRTFLTVLLVSVLLPVAAFAEEAWTPSKGVEWVVTSSAGGGSSIFTQTITEIIKAEGLVDENIIINYKTDGGGAVGRRAVSKMKKEAHTLLTFNSGDLKPMVTIEGGDLDNVTPLAVMALDGQIILVKSDFKYQTIEEIIEALKKGERLIMGGSKSDDEAIFNAMLKHVGGDMEYLRADSTSEALTQLLGGHVDMAIAKPAASFELVTAGELSTVVTASATRFSGAFDAPTFKELGYDIEFQIYRGVVGPGDMPEAAAKFWSGVFQKVSETDAWKKDYIEKFLLVSNFIPYPEATAYMQKFEDIFTAK